MMPVTTAPVAAAATDRLLEHAVNAAVIRTYCQVTRRRYSRHYDIHGWQACFYVTCVYF